MNTEVRGKPIENCEKALADLLGRKYCVLTGTGTAALKLAYSLVDNRRPKVLLPAMVCFNPILAVHYAQRTPLFADVLEQDATIDPIFVKKILEKDPEIGVVVAVHLYGHPADIKTLCEICSTYGVLLIEDLAQALGGNYSDGNLFGAGGDLSVVSFGHTKILDVGGGGALLTDNDDLAAKARFLTGQLGTPSSNMEVMSSMYRKLFYAIWECGRYNSNFYEMFDLFPKLFESLHVCGITEEIATAIRNSLSGLDKKIADRRRIASLYKNVLKDTSCIDFFHPSGPGVPWRFTFRMKQEYRDVILDKVRSAGYDISSWYPSITAWTLSGRLQGREYFPVANKLEKEVINLWVTKDYTEEKALSLTKVLKKSLNG